jgi:uncharacterized protein (TIGR02996 family)
VNHEDAFLADIIEHPDDDAPRLVFADWLEDHGQPERAEFIRLQCEVETLSPADLRHTALEKRAAAIEKKHGKEWLSPLREVLDQPRCRQLGKQSRPFRRGFVESLSLIPRRAGFLAAASDFLRRQPVQTLTLTGWPQLGHPESLKELASSNCLRALRDLTLCGSTRPTAESLHVLGSSANLPRLTRFTLVLDVSAEVLAGLVGTPLAARLNYLSMHVIGNDLPGVLELLTTAPAFPALTGLGLMCPLQGEEMQHLAHSLNLPALRTLHLYSGSDGPRCCNALLGSPLWDRLTGFTVNHGGLGDEWAQRIIDGLPDGKLQTLGLTSSGLTCASVQRLIALSNWGELEDLRLSGNSLGEGAGSALAGSPHLARLRSLSLSSCKLGEDDARDLAASPHAGNLRRLGLFESGLSQQTRQLLKKRFGGAFVFGI